jgi:hypothetical protein
MVWHFPGVQERVRGRCGQVAEIRVPGVGEVELILRFLDDPNHVRPTVERTDIRGDVAPTEQIGNALQVVQVEMLVGQEYHQAVGQRLLESVQPFHLGNCPQIDARHLRSQSAGHRTDIQPTHPSPSPVPGRV